MSIKNELSNLKENDVWSFLLFALYKIRDIPEYSGLSELAYILDKSNLLNLCEYFGGLTITIPKIEELENLLCGLLIYQYTHVERLTEEEAFNSLSARNVDLKAVRECYYRLSDLLQDYDLTSRAK